MIATCYAVSVSLINPFSYLYLFFIKLSLFVESIFTNNLINSRKDLGVVYTYLLYCSKSFVDSLFTTSKDVGMNDTTPSLTFSSPRSSFSRKRVATFKRASLGQGKNQSITVLLTKAGNCLALLLRDYPTGEKHSDM